MDRGFGSRLWFRNTHGSPGLPAESSSCLIILAPGPSPCHVHALRSLWPPTSPVLPPACPPGSGDDGSVDALSRSRAKMAQGAAITAPQAAQALRVFLERLRLALRRGERVTLAGLGTFAARSRAVRKGRHPHSGQESVLPAGNIPTFSAGHRPREAAVTVTGALGRLVKEYSMPRQSEQRGFDFDAFGRALDWKPWPYSPKGTYWDGGRRFLDAWTKARLAGFVHGALLLSEYDAGQGRRVLYPFPWPRTVDEALAALVALGWWADTVEHRAAFLKRYAQFGGR
jgi:DNA-binding protein HU-beta